MRWIVPSVLVCLTACGLPDGEPMEPPKQDPAKLVPCGADKRGGLIGLELEELMTVEILGPVRVIRPGDSVTEEFFAQRLNIYLTATDSVAALTCG
ncbi:I78 family peptidase inhibitor [Shimia ponticola]|uniref:I78 family peptidase inhibitor n=1 Tax=Shimia ponticola TaxID=2582893 RepID=UPI00164A56B4|nr:I78 family peptidase inhibitor [Shimia ponticola]